MKLIEALELLKRSRGNGQTKLFRLASGFTPLHLLTFFKAHLQNHFPAERVQVTDGLYGDLAGNIERPLSAGERGAAVVIEWADLDPRLGIRQLGGWQPEKLSDIVGVTSTSLKRLEEAIRRLGQTCPVALCLPTLPILPIDLPAGWQAGRMELDLRRLLAEFAAQASRQAGVGILNQQRLDLLSPPSMRFDARSELLTGFPYHLEHADALADMLSQALLVRTPKKGLITDLDDTCWRGILGEVGLEGISWDLNHHAQLHGIYQQFLQALAARGVLVGIATRNDASLVEEALKLPRMQLSPASVFPIVAGWGRKSDSVARILHTWNISADAVVYIDDSPMEIAEVKAAHPNLECILFPKQDPTGVLQLLARLRDLFGKERISEEDRIRSQSLRAKDAFAELRSESAATFECLLKDAGAKMHFRVTRRELDQRALELVNKTNQFNLNGRRYDESGWREYFQQDGAFLVTASYEDKFGPLGQIVAIRARLLANRILGIEDWVMSCRAFSRRIEHRCLQYLFAHFAAESMAFNWIKTKRNGPLCEFLEELGVRPQEPCLSRQEFDVRCPALYQSVVEAIDG